MTTAAKPESLAERVMEKIRNKTQIVTGTASLIRMDHAPSEKDNARARTIIRTCEMLVAEVEAMLKEKR